MANGTIAFDTLSTSGQISGTAKSVDTDYLVSGCAKAWVYALDNALSDAFNIASSTDNGTGDYTFTFSSSMANATFAVTATSNEDSNVNIFNPSRATTSYNIEVKVSDGTSYDKNTGSVTQGDLA